MRPQSQLLREYMQGHRLFKGRVTPSFLQVHGSHMHIVVLPPAWPIYLTGLCCSIFSYSCSSPSTQSPRLVAHLDQVVAQLLHGICCGAWLDALGVVRDEDGLRGLDKDDAFSALYRTISTLFLSCLLPFPPTPMPSHLLVSACALSDSVCLPSSHRYSDRPPSTPQTAPRQYAGPYSAPASHHPSRGPCRRPRLLAFLWARR